MSRLENSLPAQAQVQVLCCGGAAGAGPADRHRRRRRLRQWHRPQDRQLQLPQRLLIDQQRCAAVQTLGGFERQRSTAYETTSVGA